MGEIVWELILILGSMATSINWLHHIPHREIAHAYDNRTTYYQGKIELIDRVLSYFLWHLYGNMCFNKISNNYASLKRYFQPVTR